MHERDTDMSALGEHLAGPQGRDRDVAEWTIAADVVRRIDDFGRGEFALKHPDGWTLEEHTAIQAIRRDASVEQARDQAKSCPAAFGKWREMVTNFEELEAAKLRTLWWAFMVFERLSRLEGADVQAINAQQMRIADCLRVRWRARLDKIPTDDPRGWASRGSRRYDLLPRAWRFV